MATPREKARRGRRFSVSRFGLRLHRRQILLFCIGAVVVGLIAMGFGVGVTWASSGFANLTANRPWLPFLLCPAGLAAIVYLTRRVFPGAQGSGIPQAMAGMRMSDPRQVDRLLSWRIVTGKILLTWAGFLVGASIGKEGPTVQIGCSVMNSIGRLGIRRTRGLQRLLIMAGGAAGIASAFNAPLAGAIFAIEEMAHHFDERIGRTVLTASLLSGATLAAVSGAHFYFGAVGAALPFSLAWLAIIACGFCGGLLGGGFAQILISPMRFLPLQITSFAQRQPVAFAACCGLILACLGWLSGGQVFDASYPQARAALHGTSILPVGFFALKLLATLVSYMSGIPGGIFAPSLAVGVGLGAAFVHLDPALPLGALAMLGMAGYFSGVVQSPLTAAVIVVEMTGDTAMLIPVGLAALIGTLVSRRICPVPIYAAMSSSFLDAVEHKA